MEGGAGRPTRPPDGTIQAGQTVDEAGYGCEPEMERCYGEDGRPDFESETLPIINVGIGQKLHFNQSFSLKFELRDMILLGTETGFENLLALWGGLGFRF